jgi:hypothetical protein
MPNEVMTMTRYDNMCVAIREAYEIDDVKEMRDRSLAMAAYAKEIQNRESEQLCKEIRVRAERQLGGLTKEMKKAAGDSVPGKKHFQQVRDNAEPVGKAETLRQLGIPSELSSKCERLAAVPDAVFNRAVKEKNPSAHKIVNEYGQKLEKRKTAKHAKEYVDNLPPPGTAAHDHQRAVFNRLKAAWFEADLQTQDIFIRNAGLVVPGDKRPVLMESEWRYLDDKFF